MSRRPLKGILGHAAALGLLLGFALSASIPSRANADDSPAAPLKAESHAESRRPQEPSPPYPYDEEEVRFSGGSPEVTLAGTLTSPRRGAPFPCAILIGGTGRLDRDETVSGHRPFQVIADYLTRRGIAVLRVDDRGVGGSTGSVEHSSSKDFAEDVRSSMRFLRARHDIVHSRIGLIAHSEGGLIAPLVAAKSRDVAFIVMLAGPGIPVTPGGYDPRPALRRVKCPVLALNGDRDQQVPPDPNLSEIERALRDGGNSDVQVATLPGLNHLFQTCETGAPAEYATIEETFAPAALDLMTTWILRQSTAAER